MFEMLNKIEDTNSRNEKEKILEQGFQDDAFEFYIRAMFEPSVTHGCDDTTIRSIFIKPTIRTTDIGLEAVQGFNSDDENTQEPYAKQLEFFVEMCKKYTGSELKNFLFSVLNDNKSKDYIKWMTRLAVKNLHSGITLKTVNKVLKKMNKPIIEVFEVQLCDKISNIKDWDTFPVYVGVKYDGFRCIVEKKGLYIKMTSRQGKDVSEFLPELVEFFKTIPEDFILDGEVMAETFSQISQRIGRKADNLNEIKNLHYRAFDILQHNTQKLDKVIQADRSEKLRFYFSKYIDNLFQLEDIYLLFNKVELKQIYEKAIENNEEGLVLKYEDRTYDYGSRKNWIKIKPIIENTFKIIGYELGSGKNFDKTGKIIVEDKSGLVRAGVGSGLTDNDRLLFKQFKEDDVYPYVDVAYNEISKNKSGYYSLRFPRFLKIRNDKDSADEVL